MRNDSLLDATPPDTKKISRTDLMRITGKLIKHLDKKSIAGRLVNADIEKMRDSKTRLLIEAVKVHGSLLKDETLEVIEERLAALEEKIK